MVHSRSCPMSKRDNALCFFRDNTFGRNVTNGRRNFEGQGLLLHFLLKVMRILFPASSTIRQIGSGLICFLSKNCSMIQIYSIFSEINVSYKNLKYVYLLISSIFTLYH